MLVRKPDDEGFGLVELVVAFFLLTIIALAILPALVNGIAYSSQQSSTATATRAVNAQIEKLRDISNVACSDLQSAASPGTSVTDGRGRTIAISGPTPGCTPTTHQSAVLITLNARDSKGTTLASTTAKIYLP